VSDSSIFASVSPYEVEGERAVDHAEDQTLPCPFCGKKPSVFGPLADTMAATIRCLHCASSGRTVEAHGTSSHAPEAVDLAVANWNARGGMPPIRIRPTGAVLAELDELYNMSRGAP